MEGRQGAAWSRTQAVHTAGGQREGLCSHTDHPPRTRCRGRGPFHRKPSRASEREELAHLRLQVFGVQRSSASPHSSSSSVTWRRTTSVKKAGWARTSLKNPRLSAQERERHGGPFQPSLPVASSPVAPVKGTSENLPGPLDSIGKIHQTHHCRDRKGLYLAQPARALPAPVSDISPFELDPAVWSPASSPKKPCYSVPYRSR